MSKVKPANRLTKIAASGNNKFLFEEVKEQRKFDLHWITTLENFLPHVEKVALNIREGIKVEQEVVQIEKVRRVDSASIRHLAANSNLVREVKPDGEVVPSQLLTSFRVEDYGVYENRFLKTLINRLFIYITKRHEAVSKNYASYLRRELEVDSSFNYLNEKVKVTVDFEARQDINLDAEGQNFETIMARLDRLKIRVNGLKYSRFMQLTANEREVRPPIQRTNAILKNVDFVAAYNLWMFLDRETSLDFDIHHHARKLAISADFQNDLLKLISDLFRRYRYYTSKQRINYTALEKLRTKKPRIVKGFSGKFVIPDEEIKVEDPQYFEYYLNEITDKTYNEYRNLVTSGRSRKEAATRVLRNLVNVSDTIFDNLNLDVQPASKDIDMQLRHLKDEERILKAFIDVKEVNLRKYKRRLASAKRKIKAAEKRKKRQAERAKKQRAIARERAKLEAIKKAQEQEARRIKKEEEKAKKAILLAKQKEEERLNKQKEREKERQALARQKEKARLAALKIKEQEQARLKKQKERQKEQDRLKVQKQKEREKLATLKAKAKEQERLKKEVEKQKAKEALKKEKQKQKEAEAKKRDKTS